MVDGVLPNSEAQTCIFCDTHISKEQKICNMHIAGSSNANLFFTKKCQCELTLTKDVRMFVSSTAVLRSLVDFNRLRKSVRNRVARAAHLHSS